MNSIKDNLRFLATLACWFNWHSLIVRLALSRPFAANPPVRQREWLGQYRLA